MKKLFVVFLILTFVGLTSYSVSYSQEVKKETEKTTKVEPKKSTKKVKTIKTTKEKASKCDDCPHKGNCSKEEKEKEAK